ncbi:MAG: 6-aminohexanoate-dimer hydrolase [Betaproteobacteria bacterium ADurb.Bin341]|nr:MAG: 6-aminohexanoate-dimer hydrolase [Betaproteobacteria bacterium ADurb.Bin341]
MKYSILVLTFLALPLQATEKCSIEHLKPGAPVPWVNLDHRLAPENLRYGLQSNGHFMPRQRIRTAVKASVLSPVAKQLNMAEIKANDPLDQKERSLDFLLDSRLYADGVLILQNGRILAEKYWNGLDTGQARLLLSATRPILSLMGVLAINEGKLQAPRSVASHIPALSQEAALRKLSIRRLLEGDKKFLWTTAELENWQQAGGWKLGKTNGLRNWLNQPGRLEKEWGDNTSPLDATSPDDDLLAWALSETYHAPLAQIFCEDILSRMRPEYPAFWLTDPAGTELSSGLALSLRDFARLGQLLIDARGSGSRIPPWFIETLTTPASRGPTAQLGLEGLEKGSEFRYGFIRLGGAPNRVAILGPYGNSLYLDFDHQLVVAIYASFPRNHSPAMLATLEQIWKALASANKAGS